MELRFAFQHTPRLDLEWWVIDTRCHIDHPVSTKESECTTYKVALTVQIEGVKGDYATIETVEGVGYITSRHPLLDDERSGTIEVVNDGASFRATHAIVPSGHNTISFALYPLRASAVLASISHDLARSPS